MKIRIKVVENRMPGMGRFVQLADEPTNNLIPETDRAVSERDLWLPSGSEVYQTVTDETAVRTPRGETYLLGDALTIFGKYGAKGEDHA